MTKTIFPGRGARAALAVTVAGLMSSAPVAAVEPGVAQAVPAPVAAPIREAAAPEAPAPAPLSAKSLSAKSVSAPEDRTEDAPEAEEPKAAYRSIGRGMASYYGRELAGNRTASGERFNPQALTAAHRTLPMGSRVRVTNQSNGRSVVVRINDRGPFAHGRVVDVSLAAAHKISMVSRGTAMVKLELVN
jgi:rare lipoprotein A